ncbi:MAG: VOC family protein [Gemmatimonadetes bacterium]|nr:VOC family protein [Gemmatimonadota bacterium]
MTHNLAWFDIQVRDLDRAIRFYSAVLGAPVSKQQTGSKPLGMLPTPSGGQMGCLVPDSTAEPSEHGVMLWFNVTGRLRAAVAAVQPHGGDVRRDVHEIGGYGFRAEVVDSEGNLIALYGDTDD